MDSKMILAKFLGFLFNFCAYMFLVVNYTTKFLMPGVSARGRVVGGIIMVCVSVVLWKYAPLWVNVGWGRGDSGTGGDEM